MARRSGTVELTVAAGRTSRGPSTVVAFDDGVPRLVGRGPAGDADVTLTVSTRDAAALRDGSLDPSVAFMRGRMKMSGDFELLLQVLPVMSSAAFDEVRAGLFAEEAADR